MQHLTPVLRLQTKPRGNIQNMKPVQFSIYPAVATVLYSVRKQNRTIACVLSSSFFKHVQRRESRVFVYTARTVIFFPSMNKYFLYLLAIASIDSHTTFQLYFLHHLIPESCIDL